MSSFKDALLNLTMMTLAVAVIAFGVDGYAGGKYLLKPFGQSLYLLILG